MDRSQYLQSILSLISTTVPHDADGGVNVAKLGLAARRALPDWRDLGFLKMKDVLLELEAQSLVKTGKGQKGAFTVWMVKSASGKDTPVSSVSALQQVTRPALRPLRKEAWIAFTSPFPPGLRFLNRKSGEVLMGATQAPDPSGDWLEIPLIDQDTQRSWAVEFAEENQFPDQQRIKEAAEADDWYRRFPMALDQCGPYWRSRFNRRRSERVQQHVDEWREKNGLPPGAVFASDYPPRSRNQSPTPPDEPRVEGVEPYRRRSEQSLRQVVLSALASMNTDELCEIAIPAKILIPLLRPDLARSTGNGMNR